MDKKLSSNQSHRNTVIMGALGRRRWLIAAGAPCALAIAAWLALRAHAHDPYPFLAEQRVVDVTVVGPGSWSASETRTYTRKQPWQSVAERARHELPTYGLKERPKSKYFPDSVSWMGEIVDGGLHGIGSDTIVLIVRGKSLSPGSKTYTDDDPEWVTVLVTTDLEENWINIVRYTFFAYRD